jgi:DNA repair exonuclease SbcCD nuclease subunit
LHAPVLYPGAIERTSFAEKNEKKGYLTLELEKDGLKSGRLSRWLFHELPTRPMIQLNLHPGDMDAAKLRSYLENTICELPEDGIVKLKIHGRISQEAMTVLRAASLRSIAPPTMNIDTAFKDYNFF